MGAGQGEVKVELFINDAVPGAALPFPVNRQANASRMAIGQERDAANHPGKESFTGEIARTLIWERPLADDELRVSLTAMQQFFGIGRKPAQSMVWTGGGLYQRIMAGLAGWWFPLRNVDLPHRLLPRSFQRFQPSCGCRRNSPAAPPRNS